MTCQWWIDPRNLPFMSNKNGMGTPIAKYSCPVQAASLKNCHLIAALSSLAWINDNFLPNQKLDPKTNLYSPNYGFVFYDFNPDLTQYPANIPILNPNTVAVTVVVTPKIWMDPDTGKWCGACGCDEKWVAMYEKAFAKFCMFKFVRTLKYTDLSDPNVEPNFSDLPDGASWGGNPATVLKYLTNQYLTRTWSLISGKAGIYDQIRGMCDYTDWIGKMVPVKGVQMPVTGSMIKKPAGAWTYKNEDDAKIGNGGTAISYQDANIVADHCYSILGIHEEPTGKYLVLRNPFGHLEAPSKATLPWVFKRGMYKIQNYAPSDLTFTWISNGSFGPDDGIFALDITTFKDYFQGFGYIA